MHGSDKHCIDLVAAGRQAGLAVARKRVPGSAVAPAVGMGPDGND